MDGVKQRGDEAVKEYTAKFDRVQLQEVCIRIEVSRQRVIGGHALALQAAGQPPSAAAAAAAKAAPRRLRQRWPLAGWAGQAWRR